jgi:methanethiol S-methyltransferase
MMSVGPAASSAFAWAGGALFVAALAAGVHLFLVRLGATAGDAWSLSAALANTALFSVFALHHSVMARSGAKAWLASRVPAYLERSAFVWVSSLLFLAVSVFWQPVGGMVWQLDGAAGWLAIGAQLAGVLLTALGARVLDPLELAGIAQVRAARGGTRHRVSALRRPTSTPAAPAPPPAGAAAAARDDISDAGPYGLVRHPIYLGWFLMVCFAPVMTGDRLVFALVSSGYLVAAIPWEERSLLARHGAAYARYREKVRWRMLPGIY